LNESWTTVPGSLGYEVSDRGRLRSYRTAQGHPSEVPRLLTPAIVKGYLQTSLGRSRVNVRVHLIVLEAFEGPRPAGAVARHLNGDPLDNRRSNLRWGTAEENYDDRHGHGTDNMGARNGRAKLGEKEVIVIRTRLESGDPQRDIAVDFGVSRSTISRIKTGRNWSHI
jgi:hypothetical protein